MGGREYIDPRFPDLGISWRRVVSFKICQIYPPPGEGAPGTHWIRGRIAYRDRMNDMESWKFCTQPGF
jgi:hypothetical protein